APPHRRVRRRGPRLGRERPPSRPDGGPPDPLGAGDGRRTGLRSDPVHSHRGAFPLSAAPPTADNTPMSTTACARMLPLPRALLALVLLAAPALAAKPNIVILLADDLGYADLGFQGCKDVPTPHLDALAKSGVRCSSGYVSGPSCSPTRAGLLTGRYQTRYGHEFNPGPATEAN